MGDHPRGYFFGIDCADLRRLQFHWDSVLLHGRSFRNYGELDWHPSIQPPSKWFDIYADFQSGAGKITLKPEVELETLNKYSCANYPGWNLSIPDVVRLEAFLKEFKQYEKRGEWPNFVIVYLPEDHTAGTRASFPTPRAMVADNDLAVGRLVGAISHSRFWPKTAIFINEDDPQSGWDHVDGHRSLCLVVSPYARRHAVVSHFYNQLSVLHTMARILGLPSTAQLAAQVPTMEACFTDEPILCALHGQAQHDSVGRAEQTREGFAKCLGTVYGVGLRGDGPVGARSHPGRRLQPHPLAREYGRDAPYPAEFAGAHRRGLKALKLKATALKDEDD